MKLYEVSQAIRDLLDDPANLDFHTGALSDEGAKRLDELEMIKSGKILACAKIVLEERQLADSTEITGWRSSYT